MSNMNKIAFVLIGAAMIASSFAFAGAVKTVTPEDGATVPTLSDGQKAYVKMPRKERVAFFADQKKRNEMKALGYYPLPTKLEWDAPEGAEAKVEVKLGDKIVFATNTTSRSVEIDNLEIARKYEWSVSVGGDTAKATFTTEDMAPRLVRIPGVPNVRDLGGRVGLGGRRVRQGMVFRTAGLNDNASESFYTKEELIARDPSLKVHEEACLIDLAKWKALEQKPGDLKLVTAPLNAEWTLFFPELKRFDAEGEAALKALDGVPVEFLGSSSRKIAIKDGESVAFDKLVAFNAQSPRPVAVLIQVVEASDDGYMSMSAGGDYYWYICSNGEKAFDLEKAGNWRTPYNPDCYGIPVPVKKGKNVIAVVVRTGTGGWSWGCKSAPSILVTKLAHDKVRSIEKTADAVYGKVSKGKKAGKNRLTPVTRDYMTKTLGIKSDIDLRSDGECWGMEGSPMGDEATWFHISSAAYAGMQGDWGRKAFTEVFKIFLDEKNYPIDFHCIAGQDRTGAVAFIVNGLLGVCEEELYLDWEVTGFWNGSADFCHSRRFDKLVDGFKKWPGETINEKIEAYVLSLGFTKEDIEKLRGLMLE